MSNHLVVVGGGQAGFSLISKLRSLGDTRSISLVTAEKYPPYQRPPLSKKYLIGEMRSDRLSLRPAKWYDDQSVALYLKNKVSSIDIQNKYPSASRKSLSPVLQNDVLTPARRSHMGRDASAGTDAAGPSGDRR